MLFTYRGKIIGIPKQREIRNKWMFDFDLEYQNESIGGGVYRLGIKNATNDSCKMMGQGMVLTCELSLEEAILAKKRRVYLEPQRVRFSSSWRKQIGENENENSHSNKQR